jgi:hypothetical protein
MADAKREIPRGRAFLELVADVEAQCGHRSLEELPQLGISASACYECLGDVLSMLYAEASCHHGCLGGDHLHERIVAKVVANALSSLRLAMLGYYDESLALARSVGEIANLLFLFAAEPSSMDTWRVADEAQRRRDFAPVKVRLWLERLNLRPPVESSRYGLLSEVAVHLAPSTAPQAFNHHGRPTLGAQFQFEGLMVVLNELGVAVAEAAACISVLRVSERGEDLRVASEVLLNVVGALDLKTSREHREDGV